MSMPHRLNIPAALALTLSSVLMLGTATAQTEWNGSISTDWTNGANWTAGTPGAGDDAIFVRPIPGTGPAITLGAGSLANSLWIQDNYTFNTNDLTLTTGEIRVNLGHNFTLNSQLSGSNGLTLLGGGVLRLTNASNNYTGDTTIAGGMLVITNPAQLGLSLGPVNVTAGNNVPQNNSTVGITGGGLVLDGSGGSITFTRDLNLEGRGYAGDRSGALVSIGNNTISGDIYTAFSTQTPITTRPTRLLSSNGLLTIAGNLDVGSATAGAQVTTLGGVNTAGAGGSFAVTGSVTGLGYLDKAGAGVLFWTPDDTSNFQGRIRVSGAATGGQSSVRVTSLFDGSTGTNIFGLANAAAAAAPIDLFGGVLEIRNENSLNFGKNVFLRIASTMFVGPGLGGEAVNNTMTFGNFRLTANQTPTFNSRNGYGITFGDWTQESFTNPNTVTNNMGGTLTFTGNAWNNSDGSARTLTIAGAGNTVITGAINTSGAGVKTLTKQGAGFLEIRGSATSLNGPVNIQGGAIRITDFRSLNNNSETINLGSSNATVGLIVGTVTAPAAAGLTTSKVINLTGSGGAAHIYANQTGANPVILNANWTTDATNNKTIVLGGTNTANNVINGVIPNIPTFATPVQKIGPGTWVLAGANTFTGTTTIANGTLKIQTNAPLSTVLPSANNVTFDQITGYAGGSFEIVGQASVNNVQTIGTLTPTQGANTVRLTPGAGGTASLAVTTFTAPAASASVNIIGADATSNVFSQIGAFTAGLFNRSVYFNGTDFAFRQADGVFRAPVYGTDASFVTTGTGPLTAAANMEITGSFATNTVSINTLKINGAQTLTINGGQTLTVSTGGILATDGAGVITGNILAVGGQPLAVRVNGASDTLTLSTTNLTGSGLTKSGLGTLILNTPSTATNTITINEGTVQVGNATALGAANRPFVMRQAGTLDLNGFTPANALGAFTNNGTVTNTSATAATLTIGGGNGGGTSFGIINETAGRINITKVGSNNMSWLGTSNYTGVTTIGNAASSAANTGLITVDTLANIGQPSGIGAGDTTDNAGSLIFSGQHVGLVYTGALRETNNALTLGFTSATTDRLFTMAADTINIVSNAANSNALVWSNTGALVHGSVAPRTLILRGTSIGDNTFNPQITDSGTGSNITSLTKNEGGQWNLGNSNNTYSGATTVTNGILALNHNGALSPNSPLVLAPASATSPAILQMSGVFDRNLTATPTAGTGDVNFAGTVASTTGGVGFAAHTTPLTVAIGGIATPTPLTWGAGGFVGTSVVQNLVLNSSTALSYVDFRNAIDLGSVNRTVVVLDNINTGADYAIMSGVLSGAGGGLIKLGAGALVLTGANTYTGTTQVQGGTLQVYSLGDSSAPAATSVGDSTAGNTNAGAVVLGNGTTTGGILQYTGPGETSDRKIRLNTTTGSNQIHADGTGPLILTNVANDMTAGNKILFLRGASVYTNFIESQLSDFSGTLGVQVDGSTAWVLTNAANNYSGPTNANAGLLGIGADTALGTSTLTVNNGNVFAYGGDRTIANTLVLANNATNGWQGDYNLTFTTVNFAAAANNITTNNSIVEGKALTFNGMSANALTGNRTWTLNGPGHTIINGDFTTTTTFGVPTVINNGMLSLGGTGASNFNQNGANIDIDNGTLRFIASNAISSATGAGGILFSPESLTSDIARLELNGFSQTFTNFTSTGTGTGIVDNNSASPVSLIIGANGGTVDFGTGGGTYSILNTGAGAISLIHGGAGTGNIVSGVTLNHEGLTASQGGGVFNIAAPVNATTGLSVTNGSTLALTGGITNENLISSILVEAGSTLSLLDGAGTLFTNVGSLNLGGAGTGTVTLNLNVGDAVTAGDYLNTDTLTLLTGGTLTLGNTITFNMTDIGLNPLTTYTLLNIPDGGIAAFGIGNMIQGATPGGFDSMTWFVDDNVVQITTGNLLIGDLYWRGLTDNTWNGNVNNWSDDKAGTIVASSLPGAGSNVKFAWDGVGAGALTTTLEQNFKINSLTFEAGTTTPASVTINTGASPSNRIEIAPSSSTDGIAITAGGPATVTINTPVRLGKDQTWTVADAASLLTIGQLQGEADVTKTGPGRIVLNTAAANTFNSGLTTDVTITAGTLEMTNNTALGSISNSNLANVHINGGAFYFNGAASTIANPMTLGGGTLSAGTANQIYSGAINVSAASSVNLRDSNSAITSTAQRNITLTGVVSGSGAITLDSNDGLSGGNQFNGEFRFNNAASTWNGALNVQRGTATFANNGGVTPFFHYDGTINYNFRGRTIQQEFNGATITRTSPINFAANAIGEFQVTNVSPVLASLVTLDQNGAVNLNAGSAARFFANTAFSTINLNGGIVLNGDAAIGVGGGAVTSLVSINTTGISGTGNLGIHDNTALGGWGTTYRILAINTASTFIGNTNLGAGTLRLGHKDALSAGSLTITGTSIIEPGVDLSGANAVPNNVTQNAQLTVSGSNNITFAGTWTATGGDANRTLFGSLDAGFTLRLTGPVNIGAPANTAARTWVINGPGVTEISGAIVNGNTFANILQKTGVGTLILSNTAGNVTGTTGNTWSGGTLINAGIVRSGNDHVLPNTGTITVNATVAGSPTATLDLNGFSDTIAALTLGGTGGLATSVNSVTTGTGTLTLGGTLTVSATGNWTTPATISGNLSLGGATRTFQVANSTGTDVDLQVDAVISATGAFGVTKTGAGTLLFNAANTYTGATTVNLGELRYGVNSAINSASAVTVNPNAAGANALLNLDGFNGTIAGLTFGGTGQTATSTASVTTGTGTLTLGGNVTYNATGNPTATRLITGNLALGAANRTFNIADSTGTLLELDVQALVSSTGGGIIKTGLGNLMLSNGSNSYTGVTTINNGALVYGANNVIPSGSNVTVNANGAGLTAALALNNFNGTIASLTFGGTGGTTTSTNLVDTGTGTLTLGGNVTYNATGNPLMAVLSGNLNLGGLDRTFLVQDSTTTKVDLQVSAVISNGAITKTGPGTLEFTGTNTYAGTTSVNAGTLLINGNNGGATGNVTVAAGATLGGSGIVGGATTILGTHSPGNSPGLQTFASGLEYDGANFIWELYSNVSDFAPNPPNGVRGGSIGWDGVDITGGDLNFISPTTMSLVFNGTDAPGSTVLWTDALWTSNQQWLVYEVTGGGSILNFSNFSIFTTDWLDSAGNGISLYGGSASSFSLSHDTVNNRIYLNFTAIPEPSRALLVLIGVLGMTLRRRRQ